MKKWWAITGLLLLISGAVWANNVTINATVLPADANILFDSYQWNIPLVNDGATPYQNDQQGVMTVKSGSTWIFHIQFSSANLGYVKQGTDKIAYYVKVTELADSWWHNHVFRHYERICATHKFEDHTIHWENLKEWCKIRCWN